MDTFSEYDKDRSLRDAILTRCPDIFGFHTALNRYFRRNYEFAGETHPFYEMVYVVNGTVGITAGDAVYTLCAGQMLLHPPGEFHRIWSECDSEPHVINLSFYAGAMPYCNGRVMQLSQSEGRELIEISERVQQGLKLPDRQLLNEMRIRLELWLLRVSARGGSEAAPSDTVSAQ